MAKSMNIVRCAINPDTNTFIIQSRCEDSNEEKTEMINLNQFNLQNEKERDFINTANRLYISEMYAKHKDKSIYDGLLPLRCLINNETNNEDCISPKYLINCFIHLMDLLFRDKDQVSPKLFDRDEKITIPASDERMREMMKEMLAKQPTAFSPFNLNGEGGGGGDGSEADDEFFNNNNNNNQLGMFFSILMSQMKKVEEVLSKKMENLQNSQRVRKSANFMGRMNFPPQQQQQQQQGGGGVGGGFAGVGKKSSFILSDAITNLGESREQIHAFIKEYSPSIIEECLRLKGDGSDDDNALRQVIEILQDTPKDVSIYANRRITFPLMFRTLGQVFEVVFMKFLPRLSMTLCMIGSIYYATFLNEIKLFNAFNYQLQFPMILRIIYSCYPDHSEHLCINNNHSEKYMEDNCQSIYKCIQNVQNNGISIGIEEEEKQEGQLNVDMIKNNIDFIIKVAAKFDFENNEFSNHLYTVLNAKRGRLYEYYIIAIAGLYLNGIAKTQGLTRRIDRENNGKQFIAPIHRVLTELYQFSNRPAFKQDMTDDAGFIRYNNIGQFLNLFNSEKGEMLENCMKDTITSVGTIIGENFTS